jgi:ankyrin repeat protein
MAGQHEVVAELLLQHHQRQVQQQQGSSSASLEPHLPRCVDAAASMGHANIIRSIALVFDLKQVNWQLWRPLHDAAAAGHGSAVQLLLQQCGMAVDQVADGTTALHLAALMGHADVVQQLLQAGADVGASARRASRTALHCAARSGQVHVVQLLLQAGAEVDARSAASDGVSDGGWTPLQLAADSGCLRSCCCRQVRM